MSIADKFLSFAQTLSARLNSINVSLVNKGQSKAGTYAEIPAKIDAIETGTDLSGVTATASDVLAPKVFVDSNGTEQTGTIETKTTSDVSVSGNSVSFPSGYYADTHSGSVPVATQATPSISVSSSGVITASAIQSAGYVSSGTKSATKQLSTKSATTYTPKTSNQTISSGYYLTGTQTIKGDSNLIASNIKSGVSIFGVSGSYSGSGGRIGTAISKSTGLSGETGEVTFTLSEGGDNLIGFFLTPNGSSSSSIISGIEQQFLASLFCLCSTPSQGYITIYTYGDGRTSCSGSLTDLGESDIYISLPSTTNNTLGILSRYFKWYSNVVLIPIYSA